MKRRLLTVVGVIGAAVGATMVVLAFAAWLLGAW